MKQGYYLTIWFEVCNMLQVYILHGCVNRVKPLNNFATSLIKHFLQVPKSIYTNFFKKASFMLLANQFITSKFDRIHSGNEMRFNCTLYVLSNI